jgi:hypothetical protein
MDTFSSMHDWLSMEDFRHVQIDLMPWFDKRTEG